MTCLSAISLSVRRLIVGDDKTRLMTGAASGSAFWMIGGSTCGGTFRMAPATFSRTALAASSRSRSSTKRTVMLPVPLPAFDVIWSMPAMPLSAFSIGMMTEVTISSGLAPGSCSDTLTVAGSAFGKRSTPRSRNEKMPSTTSASTSIVAKTGRRTHSSDSIGYSAFAARRVTVRPSDRLSTSVSATSSPALSPPSISMRSPRRSPSFSSRAASLSPSTTKARLTP